MMPPTERPVKQSLVPTSSTPPRMAEWASVLLRLCSFSHFYFDAQACRCRHVDESIQTKQVDFPTHEVGDARLRDTEQLGDLGLTEVRAGQMRFQSHHQRRAQLHIFSLLVRTLDGIPYASKSILAHCSSSFVKSRYRFSASSTSVLLVFCV